MENKFKNEDDLLAVALLERLITLPKENWTHYYRKFNHWGFPDDFYDLIPDWYDPRVLNTDRLMAINTKVMERIKNEFTNEAILRIHNVEYGRMTDDEFTYWYHNRDRDEIFSKYYPREKQFKELHFWDDDVWERLKSAGLVENEKENSKTAES